jgi:RNA polymerase sigma-70 factor, ECF subfamily
MNATTMVQDDVALIGAIGAGDHFAFERLVKQHAGRMAAVARRLLRSDALQDALLCVFKNASRFENNSKLSTWLHRIIVNSCLMKLRTQGRKHESAIEELLPSFDETGHRTSPGQAWDQSPLSRASAAEVRGQVRDCIDRLPEPHRTVLILRDIEELDTADAAELLGCSQACVKTRLHRARQALRTLLAPVFESKEMA